MGILFPVCHLLTVLALRGLDALPGGLVPDPPLGAEAPGQAGGGGVAGGRAGVGPVQQVGAGALAGQVVAVAVHLADGAGRACSVRRKGEIIEIFVMGE